MSGYTLELGYIAEGVEHVTTTSKHDGAPRLGAFEKITPAAESNDPREYAALGISHLVERVTIDDTRAALTIEHTAETGTLISGTARGDGSAEALKANGWRWSRNIGGGAWYVPQSRDVPAKAAKIRATAAALELAGFAVSVEIDATYRAPADVEAGRIERQAARVEALEAKAERKSGQEDAAYARALKALHSLPEGGEPIKIGHHSERGHRAGIARADSAMRKSVEAGQEAKEATDAAEAARHTTDARYNPVTVANRIKKLNAELRAHLRRIDAPRYDSARGFVPATPEQSAATAERLAPSIADTREQIAFWENVRAGQIAAGTATNYSRETIAKGDSVKYWGGWRKVVRVNAKSVSVETGYTWSDTIEYPKITGHRAATEGEATA